jgi:hypothetical protein
MRGVIKIVKALKILRLNPQRIDEPNRKSFSVGFIYPLGKLFSKTTRKASVLSERASCI